MDLILGFEKYSDARCLIPDYIFKISREHWNGSDITIESILNFYARKYEKPAHDNYTLHLKIEGLFEINPIDHRLYYKREGIAKITYDITENESKKVIYRGFDKIDMDENGKCI